MIHCTAVLKVLADILLAVDNSKLSMLVLLDLSTVFDTTNHDIQLTRLCVSYGVGGPVLNWFRSHLTDQIQCVRSGMFRSMATTARYRVPPGSILGLLWFILYMADLIVIIEAHGLHPHLYANGTQIQGSCWFQSTLSDCRNKVSDWMRSNRLQLNIIKTEMLWC